jgi:hypothetical protein
VKREIKEAVSGVALIISFFGLLVVFYFANSSYNDLIAILAIVSIVATLASMVAFVTYSKTGWSVNGTKTEWDAAMRLFPSQRLFLGHYSNEDRKRDEIIDQKREDQYYDRRTK